MVEVETEAELF